MDPRPLPHEVVQTPPTLTPGGNVPLELLRHQRYFRGLNDAALTVVAELMRPVSYAPGEFIFRQGSSPDGMYVLEAGEVLMWTRIGDRRKDIIRFMPGSSLCLASIVESAGRLSSMEVLEPSRAWVLDIRAFERLCSQRNPVALRILMQSVENMADSFAHALHVLAGNLELVVEPSVAPADPLPEGRSTTAADAALLNVLPWAKRLTSPELATLVRIARWREVKRGHRLLVHRGAAIPMQLVVRGALEAALETTEGKKRLSMRGPGTWSGVDAYAAKIPQPYSVLARENATLLGIERTDLDALYEARDALAVRLLQEMALTVNEQFNHDLGDLMKSHPDRGPQASISSGEMMGRDPRPSM